MGIDIASRTGSIAKSGFVWAEEMAESPTTSARRVLFCVVIIGLLSMKKSVELEEANKSWPLELGSNPLNIDIKLSKAYWSKSDVEFSDGDGVFVPPLHPEVLCVLFQDPPKGAGDPSNSDDINCSKGVGG